MKGAQIQDWAAGPASLRGSVGAEAPINRERAGSLVGAAFQAVRQEVPRPWGWG